MSENQEPNEQPNASMEEVLAKVAVLDPKEFAKALHKTSHSHFQHIFDQGHSTAKVKYEAKEQELTQQVSDLKNQLSEYETRLKELTDKTPDLSQIEEKYKNALKQKDLEKETIQKELSGQIENLKGVIKNGTINSLVEGMVSELLKMDVVDADYARVKASNTEILKRVNLDEEGRIKEVYQPDGVSVYSLPDGASYAQLLAKEIFATVPDILIKDRRPGSSGYQQPKSAAAPPSQKSWKDAKNPKDKVEFLKAKGIS